MLFKVKPNVWINPNAVVSVELERNNTTRMVDGQLEPITETFIVIRLMVTESGRRIESEFSPYQINLYARDLGGNDPEKALLKLVDAINGAMT